MFIDQLPTMTHNDPESSFGWEMLEKQTCKMQTIDVFDHATKTALFWEVFFFSVAALLSTVAVKLLLEVKKRSKFSSPTENDKEQHNNTNRRG